MIKKLNHLLLSLFFLTFPLFFLNLTFDPVELSKLILLAFFGPLLFLLQVFNIFRTKNITISGATFLTPLFLIASIFLASSILRSPNFPQTLLTPSSTSTFILLFLLYFSLVTHVDKEKIGFYLNLLSLSSLSVAVFTIGGYLNFWPGEVSLPSGSLLSTAVFLSIIALYQFINLMPINKNNFSRKIPQFIALTIIMLAACLLIFHLNFDQRAISLPLFYGVNIFIAEARNLINLFLGVGPANFISAFMMSKPVLINQTPFWNLTFTDSSSFFLNLLSQTGIINGLVWLSIILTVFFRSARSYKNPLYLPLLLLLLSGFIFNWNMTLQTLTIVLLAFISENKELKTVKLKGLMQIAYFWPVIVLFLTCFIWFYTFKFYLAEINYKNSFEALSQRNGTLAYNLQRQAIILNPYLDKYHLSFSQTTLAVAQALSINKNPTAADAAKIPKLAQQAIDEARLAVKLNRKNSVNWENLSNIYAQLRAFAQGADRWAIESAREKIKIDPNNPNSYLSLGSLYLILENFDEAEINFQKALELKEDLASGHYNLAQVLIKKGKIQESESHLRRALMLLPSDHPEYQKIKNELEANDP